MCVYSNVMGHFEQRYPDWPTDWQKLITTTQPLQPPAKPTIDLNELRQLIDEFKEATKAAKTVDRLTGQENCVDPNDAEKATLEERVAKLEKLVDAMRIG